MGIYLVVELSMYVEFTYVPVLALPNTSIRERPPEATP